MFYIIKVIQYLVTCHPRSQPIERFIARQQLRKHAISIADVARQPPPRNNGSTVGSGVFYVVHPEAIARQLQFNSKHMTDKRQTRPLVREGALRRTRQTPQYYNNEPPIKMYIATNVMCCSLQHCFLIN
jgi:hypothetical protein